MRLAVKDLIDVKGVVTTAGSQYLAKNRAPASRDAECLTNARKRNVEIVGKTNLTEFAFGGSGINEYFGTPRNHFNGRRKLIPGGSSSGSAVAVANGMADVAFGTDTAGSVRVPGGMLWHSRSENDLRPGFFEGGFPPFAKQPGYRRSDGQGCPSSCRGNGLAGRRIRGEIPAGSRRQPICRRRSRLGDFTSTARILPSTRPSISALAARNFKVIRLGKAFKENWDQADKYGRIVATADAWLNGREYLDKKGVTPTTKAGIVLGELEYNNNYRQAIAGSGEMEKNTPPGVQESRFHCPPDTATHAPQTSLLWQVGHL